MTSLHGNIFVVKILVANQPVEAEEFISSMCLGLRLRGLSKREGFHILILTKH